MGEVNRVYLYSAFGTLTHPAAASRGSRFTSRKSTALGSCSAGSGDVTVNGLAFSTMADSTAGGRQIDGFHGISLGTMRSTKFMHADGGWERVVWMPHETKERLKDYIPSAIYPTIATEKDVGSIDELRSFLKDHHHPVTGRWESEAKTDATTKSPISVFSGGDIPITAGGFRIILKNAKITAEKVIIQPIRPASYPGGAHHDGKKQ